MSDDPEFELTPPEPRKPGRIPKVHWPLPAIYPMPKNPSMSPRAMARRRSEARRLLAMHTAYGAGPSGATCRSCEHLQRHRQGTRWLKCGKARNSSSDATDWRAKWPACGAYGKAEGSKS